jgi:hypothetical protein
MLQYICALPNTPRRGRVPSIISSDPAAIATFVERLRGRTDYGLYFCVNPLLPGSTTRSKETVAEIVGLRVDLDFRSLESSPDDIDQALRQLPLAPTEVRNSGGGRHVDWMLKEPIPRGTPEYDQACELLVQLTGRMSADPNPAHPAALLRLPNSFNCKYGAAILVEPIFGSGAPVDITEIEALVDLLPEGGLFPRKAKPASNGHDHTEGGPRTAGEHRASIDVDQRLADMRHKGPGDASIHRTQLHCTGSLVRCGCPVDDAVFTVLEATKKAVAGDPEAARWNWAVEEFDIRRMCCDLINKSPELSEMLPDSLRTPFEAARAAGKKAAIVYARHIGWHVRGYGESNNGKAERPGGEHKKEETEGSPPRRKLRFKLVAFSDLRPGLEPLYLVDELIPVAGLVDVWGKAKCYKSFWCLDLMLHVAMGWEYRDRYVRQGAVVYCAFEGAHGYKKRVEALRRHYEIVDGTDVPLHVMPGQANLIAEHAVLIADITEQLGAVRPAAVVLDTLNKSLFGSENKDVDMGAYVRAAEAIRDAFGCVVIIIHHCGYDDTRPRGHSSLPGAVDAQLAVTRTEEVITVTVEMMRDGPEDTQVVSAVEVVEVGQDQNGKVLTSLAVVPSDADAASREHRDWPRRLSVFHTALKSALAAHGEAFQPEPGMLPVRAVDLRFIRDRFYATYAEAEEDTKKRQDKLRQAFNRALGDAQKGGVVRVMQASTGRTLLWLPVRGEI